jgi:hypothetical protein
MPITAYNPETGERIQLNEKSRQWEPMSKDFSFGRMISNVPDDAVAFGENFLALFNGETWEGFADLAQGAVQKLIPGEQGKEGVADAFGKVLEQQYGSWDNFKRYVETQPVHAASDIAGLMMGGGALLSKAPGAAGKVGQTVAKAGAMVDPLNVAGQTVAGTASLIPGANKAARALYQAAAKFPISKSGNPAGQVAERAEKIETALSNKLMPTNAGYGKLEKAIRSQGGRLGDVLSDAQAAGKKADILPVIKALNDHRNTIATSPMSGRKSAVARIDRMINDIIDGAGGQNLVDPMVLQQAKVELGKQINWNKILTTQATDKARKVERAAQRQAIEALDPRIAGMNEKLAPLMDLRDDLAASASRIGNRNVIGSLPLISGGVGAAGAGPIGGAAGLAVGLLTEPRVQAGMALAIRRLIEAGMNPNHAARIAPLLGANAANQIGEVRAQ